MSCGVSWTRGADDGSKARLNWSFRVCQTAELQARVELRVELSRAGRYVSWKICSAELRCPRSCPHPHILEVLDGGADFGRTNIHSPD